MSDKQTSRKRQEETKAREEREQDRVAFRETIQLEEKKEYVRMRKKEKEERDRVQKVAKD